jgi:uncharacterized protein YaiE (UPF0345 family)
MAVTTIAIKKHYLTLTVSESIVTSKGVYCLSGAEGEVLDVANNTTSDIRVANSNSFTVSTASDYLSIPAGSCYNGLKLYKDSIYIQPLAAGKISIVLRRGDR